MKYIHRATKGQSLIEIVVAVGIIAVVLVGVSDLVTRSLWLSSFQTSKNAAVSIAQNQLTHYRKQRDQNLIEFFINPQLNYSACVGTFDSVKYVCTITYVAVSNGVNMKVSIIWKDGEKSVETKLSQFLGKLPG